MLKSSEKRDGFKLVLHSKIDHRRIISGFDWKMDLEITQQTLPTSTVLINKPHQDTKHSPLTPVLSQSSSNPESTSLANVLLLFKNGKTFHDERGKGVGALAFLLFAVIVSDGKSEARWQRRCSISHVHVVVRNAFGVSTNKTSQ